MKRKNKELLFSVTKKELIFDYYNGSGKGGQNRNKNKNCCRIKHEPSGAVGNCQEFKSKRQNTKTAFRRMTQTKEFKEWIRVKAAEVTGQLAEIEKRVEKELAENVLTEVKEDGVWVKEE